MSQGSNRPDVSRCVFSVFRGPEQVLFMLAWVLFWRQHIQRLSYTTNYISSYWSKIIRLILHLINIYPFDLLLGITKKQTLQRLLLKGALTIQDEEKPPLSHWCDL